MHGDECMMEHLNNYELVGTLLANSARKIKLILYIQMHEGMIAGNEYQFCQSSKQLILYQFGIDLCNLRRKSLMIVNMYIAGIDQR